MAALKRVNHPNVVKAIWSDHEGPLWYLVTEFVDGKSLDECRRGDDVWALSVMIEALRGLEAVHPDDARIDELKARSELSTVELGELQSLVENGLVHRDIKPENIMVDEKGHATLVDFNIASPARERGKTRSGTPEYMAPDAGYDGWEPADDLFSCGVVLYELLLGAHPFPDRLPVAGMPPTDPLALRPSLPPDLAQLLVRSSSTLRAERFQNSLEMRVALEAARSRLEEMEADMRMAVWRWQQSAAPPPPAGTDQKPQRTEESVRLARILVEQLRDPPFGESDEEWLPRLAAGGDGHRDGNDEDPDEDDDEDGDSGDEDDDEDLAMSQTE